MPRESRENLDSNFVHVLVQGINREFILDKNEYIEKYLHLLKTKKKNLYIYIISYCIMNNHIHLLIYYNNLNDLSKYMQKVNTAFAKYYNQTLGRVGFVFRDRYKTEPILNERHLINCIKYIHNNPVKANIVNRCDEYTYSSYKDFLCENKINEIYIETGVNIDINSIIEQSNTEYFIDIDENIEMKMDIGIINFCKKENLHIYKLYEDRDICKKIIKFLKEEYKITYVNMMKKFDIPRGTFNGLID